jgi:hypothetical protein
LCWACWRGHEVIANTLIQHGALEAWKKVKNQKQENGKQAQSPLLCLILRKKLNILKNMLESESEDVMQLATEDNCLLLRAASGGFVEGVQVMLEYGYDDIGIGSFGESDDQKAGKEQQPHGQSQQHQQPEEESKIDVHKENLLQFQRLVEQNAKLREAIRDGLQKNREPKMFAFTVGMKFDDSCVLRKLTSHPNYDVNLTKEFLKMMSCRMLQQL